MKKAYLKTEPMCKVTFALPKEAVGEANCVYLVGEFNNWQIGATPMKKLKSGEFKTTLKLKRDKEYQFRYLIDDSKWENDWHADKYVTTPFGDGENSVVVV